MNVINIRKKPLFRVQLTGNPNVGKSTVFNALTGMHQHTGNWAGKTVQTARGSFSTAHLSCEVTDLPGTYSLLPHSPEEEVACEALCSGQTDLVVVVCDATAPVRNLSFALQILPYAPRMLICLNLMDEAKRQGIGIDAERLEKLLGVRVVAISARKRNDVIRLKQAIEDCLLEPVGESTKGHAPLPIAQALERAEEIADEVITHTPGRHTRASRRADRLLTGRVTGILSALLLLFLTLWLTVSASNLPSRWLSEGLSRLLLQIHALLSRCHAPPVLQSLLCDGVLRVTFWVVSVMLPPMAIFFPLFTLLEDAGYLPRVAFTLDRPFSACNACGKQALTTCMGFGCNAVGVTGCRIIDSPRERLLAILCNALVPCNGRFPALITLIGIFFVGSSPYPSFVSALLLLGLIVLSILVTFGMTKLLSVTLLRGKPSSFTLELPPYRMPDWKRVLVRSLLDRTVFVLGRAAAVAAPAGLLLWLLANLHVGSASLLLHAARFLHPFANLMGLDGVTLLAFVLGTPANEIVLPIVTMAYLSEGGLRELASATEMRELLLQNGWDSARAVSAVLFFLFHWPCATTLLTVKKETGKWRWVALAWLLPTLLGILLTVLFTAFVR